MQLRFAFFLLNSAHPAIFELSLGLEERGILIRAFFDSRYKCNLYCVVYCAEIEVYTTLIPFLSFKLGPPGHFRTLARFRREGDYLFGHSLILGTSNLYYVVYCEEIGMYTTSIQFLSFKLGPPGHFRTLARFRREGEYLFGHSLILGISVIYTVSYTVRR